MHNVNYELSVDVEMSVPMTGEIVSKFFPDWHSRHGCSIIPMNYRDERMHVWEPTQCFRITHSVDLSTSAPDEPAQTLEAAHEDLDKALKAFTACESIVKDARRNLEIAAQSGMLERLLREMGYSPESSELEGARGTRPLDRPFIDNGPSA